ncbi:hypothetical protein [Geodermatophilus sp. TF02-6]|uniref:hypothetical protein n=1 Tax=Geodermatophilus sp. TF02-6 TaxID=2250575 RepID=UPI00131427CE|nr:hypothetical protein [Geodermatophilus sp. TF02-6]
MTTDPPRDYAKLAQYARARLIVSAASDQTCPYGELSRFAQSRWYATRVLGAVYAECVERGEPDLTAILVKAGELPQDLAEAEAVYAYWREVHQ